MDNFFYVSAKTHCDYLVEMVLRRVTTYIFMEKFGKLSLNYPCYPFLSTAPIAFGSLAKEKFLCRISCDNNMKVSSLA